MTGFESHRGCADLANAALLRHGDGHTFGRVRRLLGSFRHLVFVVVIAAAVMVAVLVVESLQREAPMSLLATAAAFRYVWVVLSHCLCFEYL